MGDEVARLHALERQLGEQVASLGAREAELNHQVRRPPIQDTAVFFGRTALYVWSLVMLLQGVYGDAGRTVRCLRWVRLTVVSGNWRRRRGA